MVQNFAKVEIEVLKKVTHNNVLKFLGSYERGTSVYIITEACETTLLDKLRKDRKRDPKTVLATFLQILEGY
jgi:serine/threonine protein kinase